MSSIGDLINYGIEKNLITEEDRIYIGNRIIELIGNSCTDFTSNNTSIDAYETLDRLMDTAYENGLMEDNTITNRDLLDTKIMALFTPLPSHVIKNFYDLYRDNRIKATDYFYNLSKDTCYIRTNRIDKNIKWVYEEDQLDLDITINLSKPEKDPKDIIKARNTPKNNYPKCLLCAENQGFAGNTNHPARQNIRLMPFEINNEKWFLQYSPYSYFNEHSILLSEDHRPMKISKKTFETLLSFVEALPHYFMGSNSDIPIVGGSILSHDHYQGGNYIFPIDKVDSFYEFELMGVKGKLLNWPMSAIKIYGKDKEKLIEVADYILDRWIKYEDIDRNIIPFTNHERHNAITPIARMENGEYSLNLVLRNNRTTDEYPLGIFHPHQDIHHIKKENIGLIEVMGLAILPKRLLTELKEIENILENNLNIPDTLDIHKTWIEILKPIAPKDNLEDFLRQEVGKKFKRCLTDAGVFKQTEDGKQGFINFINFL